ncbi:MAG: type II toxin-antitoxin system prevent-host-death family antitoxin, partial [Chloroflexota bacterium]|nr:type II toxin-antitoxin system prevent-host-death family antitoxin [Chloroflexota bacterium]
AHVLNQVAYGGQHYVVERRGNPLVAIIPALEYDELLEMLSNAGVSDEIHGIAVQIRFDGERYFVSDDQFDLYGEGRTLKDARQDYWLAVQDYVADLEADADRLSPYLANRLTRLRAILSDDARGGAV